jgi:transposase
MNIQLSQAVTDVMGMTGQMIIRAIVAGLRDPEQLASFRDPGCKHSEEEIAKALTGTWREEHLYVLKQSLELYDFYTEKMEACDAEISRQYGTTRPDWVSGELPVVPDKKRHTHSKNAPKDAKEIREHLYRINGVDLSMVDGFGISLAQTVTMEVGSNVAEKFPTEKHFSAWLGVAPKHDITGGKVISNHTLKTKNRAGQAFRTLAPHCVWCSRCGGAIGEEGRLSIWSAVSAIAVTVGTGPGDGGNGTRYRAGGVQNAQVQSGI